MDGGSVYLEAIDDVTSLERLVNLRSYRAGTGAQGEGRDRDGKKGEDLVIKVPVGTTALDRDSGEVLADLTEVGRQVLIAQGGLGGARQCVLCQLKAADAALFRKWYAG